MLRKLIELLPVSRRKYAKDIVEVIKVLQGLIEAEANHCQIETNLIQHLQKGEMMKPTDKKSSPGNGTNMYG